MSGLDLYQTQRSLALMFVYAAAVGFLLGGVYDLLRVLRVFCGDRIAGEPKGRRPPIFAVLLFAEDLIFSVTAALTLILLCYYTNDGRLRAPAVVGMAGGFFVYMQTVGRITARVAEPLSRLVKQIVKTALSLLLRPLLWLGGLTARLIRLLWRVTWGKALRKRREKQTERAIHALKDSAKRGFDLMNSRDAISKKK